MQGLSTMMTGADRDSIVVKYLRNVMGMDILEGKCRHSAFFVSGWTKDFHVRDFFESLKRVFCNFMFMCRDIIHAYRRKIIHCRAKADCLCNGRCSSFEFVRKGVRAERAKMDYFDHIA